MKVRKAVITAAGKDQRSLPLQTLIDRDGEEKSVLQVLVEQALAAGVEEVCVVTWPGDEGRYGQAVGNHAGRVRFVAQPRPQGYGHAMLCAREFTGDAAFLHLVGDHLYVSCQGKTSAQRLVETLEREECSVSAVHPTRESQLVNYGAVGGRRLGRSAGLYRIDTVIEKPTPTEAEQKLVVPGLRAGFYFCFFGMHALTPAVMELLARRLAASPDQPLTLSESLGELAKREQYLALEAPDRRYDIGVRYGLLTAQLALALSGSGRDEVLTSLLELMADREMTAAAGER